MGAADYVGIATCITATAAAVVSIVVAVRQPRIGQKLDEVHAAVSTSNGHTLGELVEGNEQRAVTRGEAPTP